MEERREGATETSRLLQRHAAGDESALGRLLERYRPTVARIVRVRLNPTLRKRVDVDDVVQEAMLRAIQGISGYQEREDARFVHWLARVTERTLLQIVRREGAARRDRRREVSPPAPSPDRPWEPARETTSVPERIMRAERKAILDTCVAELPDAQRDIILLRDYAGASWEFVCEELGRPTVGAAQQLHARARQALKLKLAARLRHPQAAPARTHEKGANRP